MFTRVIECHLTLGFISKSSQEYTNFGLRLFAQPHASHFVVPKFRAITIFILQHTRHRVRQTNFRDRRMQRTLITFQHVNDVNRAELAHSLI